VLPNASAAQSFRDIVAQVGRVGEAMGEIGPGSAPEASCVSDGF